MNDKFLYNFGNLEVWQYANPAGAAGDRNYYVMNSLTKRILEEFEFESSAADWASENEMWSN